MSRSAPTRSRAESSRRDASLRPCFVCADNDWRTGVDATGAPMVYCGNCGRMRNRPRGADIVSVRPKLVTRRKWRGADGLMWYAVGPETPRHEKEAHGED